LQPLSSFQYFWPKSGPHLTLSVRICSEGE
jgi:hypothetical protein